MRAVVLGSLFRQGPRAGIEIEFGPAHATDLLPPTTEQDQQAHDSYRRYAEAFLVDLAAESHGTWISAANIRVMRARRDVKVGVSFGLVLRDVHRRDQRDVRQVCSTAEGIIQNHHVARPEIN